MIIALVITQKFNNVRKKWEIDAKHFVFVLEIFLIHQISQFCQILFSFKPLYHCLVIIALFPLHDDA